MLKPSSNFADRFKAVLLLWIIFMFILVLPCSPVIACWEKADLLALLCAVFSCVSSLSHRSSGSGIVLDCIDS